TAPEDSVLSARPLAIPPDSLHENTRAPPVPPPHPALRLSPLTGLLPSTVAVPVAGARHPTPPEPPSPAPAPAIVRAADLPRFRPRPAAPAPRPRAAATAWSAGSGPPAT